MKTKLMLLTAGVCAALLGCGDDKDLVGPAFADGLYRVHVTERKQTCTGADGKKKSHDLKDQRTIVDVLEYLDGGTFDIAAQDSSLPFMSAVTPDAEGNFTFSQAAEDNPEGGFTAVGRFGEHGGFTVKLKSSYGQRAEGNYCEVTEKATGTRRPLENPEASDGLYDAYIEFSPFACPATPRFEDDRVAELDIAWNGKDTEASYGIDISFERGLVELEADLAFNGLVRGEQGSMAFGPEGPSELITTVLGVVDAPDAMLTVTDSFPMSDGSECGSLYKAFAKRRTPDRALLENDYRTHYSVEQSAGCTGDAAGGHASVRISNDLEGKLTLTDYVSKRLVIEPDANGYFTVVSRIAEIDGFDLSLEGTVGNGELQYVMKAHLPGWETNYESRPACDATITGTGTIRYIQ